MSNGPESSFAPCSIGIKCADDPLIERCLDSIDDPTVSVNAVITPSYRIQDLLEERGVPYVITDYGNIAKSAQLSLEHAEHDNVIIMDSDAYFGAGAIQGLRRALSTAVVAKPRLEVLEGSSHISKVISKHRKVFNDQPNYAVNPGLALRRTELEQQCGGYIFNPKIRWTEDADLNYRMQKNDVPLTYVPDAVLYHNPVALKHELRCALLYGAGKRLSIEHTPGRDPTEELSMIARRIIDGTTFRAMHETVHEKDLGGAVLSAIWRTLYLAGYHIQKHTKRWSLPEDA